MRQTARRMPTGRVFAIACVLFLGAAPLWSASQEISGDSATLRALEAEFTSSPSSGAAARRGPMGDGLTASLEAAREQSAWAAGFLKKLGGINAARLSHDDWILHALMTYEAGIAAEADRFFWQGFEVTPYSSPLRTIAPRFGALPISTDAERLAYLDALHQIPAAMAAYEARLRSQAARGIIVPAPELDLVVPFVRTLVADPASSAFALAPARLASLPAAVREPFESRVRTTLSETVVPSVERLAAFLNGPYRAMAPSTVGLSQYPGGRDYYAHLIRRHTGIDAAPEEIHRIGLAEVARLNAELDTVRRDAGFVGSLDEFRKYLKTDRRLFPATSAEIGETMMAAIRRIEPKVSEFFVTQPAAPYGVLRLDASLEASMTYGFYQLPSSGEPRGLYRFNGSNHEERSLLMAAATIYHELVPGHHFQMGLRAQNTALRGLRRTAMYSTFTEGWAEYASDLAGEMGMYADPLARAGRLAMDLFLSTRLVVDTGMNALGWSRDRAMAFMREHTLESELQISTETLRYSTDLPGQALAYKLGALKIHELRRVANQRLADRFDLRRFHEYLLASGSLPLSILDEHLKCLGGERHPLVK